MWDAYGATTSESENSFGYVEAASHGQGPRPKDQEARESYPRHIYLSFFESTRIWSVSICMYEEYIRKALCMTMT